MKFTAIIRDSLIDYPGKNSLVVFSKGCNFNCPSCYAKQVRDRNVDHDPLEYIGDWTDGVVLLGGEPTIYNDIYEFSRKIKGKNISVKLDTNGSNPEVIKRLIAEGLVDYIAMDIKSDPLKYDIVTGVSVDISKIEESIRLISESKVEYEFRTTIVPIKVEGELKWLDLEDIRSITEWIKKVTNKSEHKYYLQKFVSRPLGEMLDDSFSIEKLPEDFQETPLKHMKSIRDELIKDFPGIVVRGM